MKPFHFKQFKIYHEHSFKVGTDGVLLGTWVDVKDKTKVLDIGTGSGLIPLIIAQRSLNTEITGVEIDELSFLEATENVKKSPWNNRITILHTTIQVFAEKSVNEFDLIVSNPPYFINSMKSGNKKKNTARHTDSLSFEDLLKSAKKSLSSTGTLTLVLPKTEGDIFIETAKIYGFHLVRLTEVQSKKDKPIERLLMAFSFQKKELKKDNLIIQFETRNGYTAEYRQLTEEFYTIFS